MAGNPAVGTDPRAVPLFLLFEWLGANFPNHFSIILGGLFILIVFVLPDGVLAALEKLRGKEKTA